MKKLLSFFAIMCLVGIVSVKAQSASDSSYARDLSYSTITLSTLPDTLSDTLTSACKLLKDIREGSAAKGYTFTLSSTEMMNIKMLSGGWDCYLYLLDSSYNVLTSNDDWGGSQNGSRIIWQLPSGTYHLLACNYNQGLVSSPLSYRLVFDTCSFGDFSTLAYEPKTFGRPFTDSLSNGGQVIKILGGGMLYAKGYSMNLPADNVMLQIDTRERMLLIIDSNNNLMSGYGNTRNIIIPAQQAATYRFVVVSNDDWELDTTLGHPFTVTSGTINAATFATLSYRNVNIGDTIVDSINSTDPYLLSGSMGVYYLKNAKGAKSPNGLTHARGYRFSTSATDKFLQFTAENVQFDNSSYFFLLDSNKNTILSFYNYSYGEKYLSVNPSSTYYIVATSNSAEDTGIYRFFTRTDTDIPVYYVDALNGNDDSNGLTPATAKRTLDAVGYTTAKARVYLTENYRFTSSVTLGRYFEIYPYGKNIRLYPEITGWSQCIRVNGNLVFGKNGDTLYFVIDSVVNRTAEEFLAVNGGVIEVNNLKVRNTVYDASLFECDSLAMNNCEFVNDSIGNEIYDSYKVRMVNTTVSNNVIGGSLFRGSSFYFENSTVSGNTSTELSAFEMGSVVLKSGSVTNNRVALDDDDYDEIIGPLNARTANLAGLFFVFYGGLTMGPNFSMDTSACIFMDRTGVINTPEVMTAPLAAKVYPINYDFYTISPDYYEGRRILAGPANVLAANRTHFAIVQPADQTWYLHNNGCIYTSQQGIAQTERADVALYPNPASDRFVVELNGTEADEICLFDIYGKQVKRVAASQGANSIGVQDFARGIYFVQVRKNGTVVATRKLVKK